MDPPREQNEEPKNVDADKTEESSVPAACSVIELRPKRGKTSLYRGSNKRAKLEMVEEVKRAISLRELTKFVKGFEVDNGKLVDGFLLNVYFRMGSNLLLAYQSLTAHLKKFHDYHDTEFNFLTYLQTLVNVKKNQICGLANIWAELNKSFFDDYPKATPTAQDLSSLKIKIEGIIEGIEENLEELKNLRDILDNL